MLISGRDSRTRFPFPRFPFLVAIETDPDRTPGELGGRPKLLDQGDSEQMLAHLTADLGTVLGGIRNCHLVTCGALFDQCQVLRPGLPVFEALSALLKKQHPDVITPGQTALGAHQGVIPEADLTPDTNIPPAVLLLLPVLITGSEQLIRDLAEEMEHRFLGEGQVSAHTASWLEAAFGVGISHARFMTLTDLNAMFRLQLEHFGYLPLWELTDAAVYETPNEMTVQAGNGTSFHWRDGEVVVQFQTFDYWASRGSGRNSEDDELGRSYAEWCRELRRYASTLTAHQVPVRFELPAECSGQVSDHYLYEETSLIGIARPLASITEHSCDDLGVVAITVQTKTALRNFYPLSPRGLNEIHETIRNLELSGEGMAFPGRIRFQKSNRRLRPASFDA